MIAKETLIPITDPVEIASIQSDEFGSILGGQIGDVWWAYKFTVLEWRERQRLLHTDEGKHAAISF